MVNNIVRSKYISVENNKIEILFSNYIFGLTFHLQSNIYLQETRSNVETNKYTVKIFKRI